MRNTAHAKKLQAAGWRVCRRYLPDRWPGCMIPTRRVLLVARRLSAPAAARIVRDLVARVRE